MKYSFSTCLSIYLVIYSKLIDQQKWTTHMHVILQKRLTLSKANKNSNKTSLSCNIE